jgi:hypothetical protein
MRALTGGAKLVIVGDGSCGKSTMLIQFSERTAWGNSVSVSRLVRLILHFHLPFELHVLASRQRGGGRGSLAAFPRARTLA